MKNLISILLFLLVASSAFAVETGSGKFTPPTERENGAPLAPSEIGGYNVYINGVLDDSVSPLTADAVSFTTVLTSIINSITIKTFDKDGRESTKDSVPIVINTSPPNPPSNITVTVTVTISQ